MVQLFLCIMLSAPTLFASKQSPSMAFLNQVLASISSMKEIPDDSEYFKYLDETEKNNKERADQKKERTTQRIDKTVKLVFCHSLFHMNNQKEIFELPAIKERLKGDIDFLESQLPQKFNVDLTLKPRVFEPMKCFTAFGYLIDSWRSILERRPLCAPFYANIAYDARKYKPLKYRTYDYNNKRQKTPTKLNPVACWAQEDITEEILLFKTEDFDKLVDNDTYDLELDAPALAQQSSAQCKSAQKSSLLDVKQEAESTITPRLLNVFQDPVIHGRKISGDCSCTIS